MSSCLQRWLYIWGELVEGSHDFLPVIEIITKDLLEYKLVLSDDLPPKESMLNESRPGKINKKIIIKNDKNPDYKAH